MNSITIGRLSAAAGVKVTTIRYYESIGLMGEPDRSESGQRRYGDEAVQRLSFIRQARDLGFPVDSIRELIELQTRPDQDCGSIDAITQRQLADVRKRIARLRSLEHELGRMLKACAGGRVESCRVLAALNERGR